MHRVTMRLTHLHGETDPSGISLHHELVPDLQKRLCSVAVVVGGDDVGLMEHVLIPGETDVTRESSPHRERIMRRESNLEERM